MIALERYFKAIALKEGTINLPTPIEMEEKAFYNIAEAVANGGGGGDSPVKDVQLDGKSVVDPRTGIASFFDLLTRARAEELFVLKSDLLILDGGRAPVVGGDI